MGVLEISSWALELRPHLPSRECEVHKGMSSEGVRLRSGATRLGAVIGFLGSPT